jgi:hypothetical protein
MIDKAIRKSLMIEQFNVITFVDFYGAQIGSFSLTKHFIVQFVHLLYRIVAQSEFKSLKNYQLKVSELKSFPLLYKFLQTYGPKFSLIIVPIQ